MRAAIDWRGPPIAVLRTRLAGLSMHHQWKRREVAVASAAERDEPGRQVRLARLAAQRVELGGIAGAALDDDAVDIGA